MSGIADLMSWHSSSAGRATGGNTRAWVQAYIPGPGWIDFDPSTGLVGNHILVRVAVAQNPREPVILQRTWHGYASDHVAMRVAVRVSRDRELYCDPFLNQKVEGFLRGRGCEFV
jgi:transglutaminase-like putative cysteine protease